MTSRGFGKTRSFLANPYSDTSSSSRHVLGALSGFLKENLAGEASSSGAKRSKGMQIEGSFRQGGLAAFLVCIFMRASTLLKPWDLATKGNAASAGAFPF
jgi:hypothetical protein